MERIVHSLAPVTLVGGGAVGATDLAEALTLAPRFVAADGGALPVLEAGMPLEAVMGDFDSLPPQVRAALPQDRVHHTPDQNFTDFEKALQRIDAPLILGVGFTGGRMDHQLAAFHTLVAHPHRLCVLLGPTELVFHCPRHLALPTEAAETVSLFPMAAVGGRSEGLEWAIEGLAFAPMTRIGTSNRALGPCVLEMHAPGMLGIVPRRLAGALIEALVALPEAARWSARAE